MDMVIPISEVLLAALIHASLQVQLGTLLLLYHASLGKHIKKRTKTIVSSYIAGIGTLVFLSIAAVKALSYGYHAQLRASLINEPRKLIVILRPFH